MSHKRLYLVAGLSRVGRSNACGSKSSSLMPALTPPSVDSVIARMDAALRPLPAADGVACFVRLYLAVTEGVQARLATQRFADPSFLADLDRRFAALFFEAVEANADKPRTAPRAWAPLFEARSRRKVAPLQFALAGMNAHIGRDLPLALVAAWEQAGLNPQESSAQHTDYLRVNDLLADVERQVKEQYLSGWLRAVDRAIHRVHRLDDVVAMWDVRRARDAAWTNAQALWALRADPALAGRYAAALDRSVGFAGRGLLIPADTWLGKLGWALHLHRSPRTVR
jgi:hypothetical protein